jgi:hypothetical protein
MNVTHQHQPCYNYNEKKKEEVEEEKEKWREIKKKSVTVRLVNFPIVDYI